MISSRREDRTSGAAPAEAPARPLLRDQLRTHLRQTFPSGTARWRRRVGLRRMRRRAGSVLQQRDQRHGVAHHRVVHRAARARRRLRAPARPVRGAQGDSRAQHGEGRRGDGRVGSPCASGRRAAVARPRRLAGSHRIRRLDRHSGFAARSGREGRARDRRRLSANQDQDQARLGCRRRRSGARPLQRRAADGRRERRLHAPPTPITWRRSIGTA